MAFNNPASKLERAVQAWLILQNKATQADCFISNDSRTRNILPNRTVKVVSFHPTKFYRPEGVCELQIQHHFPAVVQPNVTNINTNRVASDVWLGNTMDSMGFGDGQSLEAVADGITAAGRWLAKTDGTPAGDQIAADNADLANFRCDWVKASTPLLIRGNDESKSTNWIEILCFSAFVSTSKN